jgi:hypothetical protein
MYDVDALAVDLPSVLGKCPAPMTNRQLDADDTLVIPYLMLRKAVGFLGMLLPVILVAGCPLVGPCRGIEDSISAYYGTGMRDEFVGLLFAIGLFLYSYEGYEKKDDRAGNIACGFAVGVALFPTTSTVGWVHAVHYVFAAGLFLTLSYFSLCLFTKTGDDPPTDEKKIRNKIYVACGAAMLACIALIVVFQMFLTDTALARAKPVLVLESLALWAFGISWMIKGEVILEDRP